MSLQIVVSTFICKKNKIRLFNIQTYFLKKGEDFLTDFMNLINETEPNENQATGVNNEDVHFGTVEDADNEITSLITDAEHFHYATHVPRSRPENSTLSPTDLAQLAQFIERNPVFELELTIGSNEIARHCCCNHKFNLAIRDVMFLHRPFRKIFGKVNRSCASIKRSIKESAPFIALKCRLRCHCLTRWSLAFLVFEAVLRAFIRGLFVDGVSQEDPRYFPIDRITIEIYHRILREAHILSLKWQRSDASIAEVIPAILKLIADWERLVLPPEPKRFRDLLVYCTRKRFEYELNSPEYLVSSNYCSIFGK